jgi:PAT family beta-lactamase induction signal transducer AmpG
MVFLGISSGFPFGVLADPLIAWLHQSGVSKTDIGLFALVSLPYSVKFLWAPIIDRLPLPVMTRFFGRRRGWALLTQAALICVVFLMGQGDPSAGLLWFGVLGLAIAFASASQDIVIDAYRVEILSEDKLAAGAANVVFGWRLGQLGAAAGGLIFATYFPWSVVFTGLAAITLVGMIAILVNPEPSKSITRESLEMEAKAEAFLERRSHLNPSLAAALAWLYGAVVCPFVEFMSRRAWICILFFILLYKFGDQVLAVMKIPFFLELGFSKTEIAGITKIFGFNAVIAGGFLGGLVLARLGIMRGLVVCGVLMAASNLVFVLQAVVGYDLWMLTATIAVENVTTGMGTTAFVAYLSSLCNVAYTATQYALLTSLMAFSRTVMSSGAGWLADHMDWISFFIVTTLAAVPGLLLLIWMIRRYPPEEAQTQPAEGPAVVSGVPLPLVGGSGQSGGADLHDDACDWQESGNGK